MKFSKETEQYIINRALAGGTFKDSSVVKRRFRLEDQRDLDVYQFITHLKDVNKIETTGYTYVQVAKSISDLLISNGLRVRTQKQRNGKLNGHHTPEVIEFVAETPGKFLITGYEVEIKPLRSHKVVNSLSLR
jgi:hypothetical protein